MADGWFRDPAWDDAARDDFEVRLHRASPHNRQQYLRIKGLALRSAGLTDAARDVLERAAGYPGGYLHETVSAWETLADMATEAGDRATAEKLYRRILVVPNQSGSSGTVELSLAELLLDGGRPHDREEASELLAVWTTHPGLRFDHDVFRWNLVRIRLAESVDDPGAARAAAGAALALVDRGPQLSRHPDVGLVRTDEATVERLRQLAQ